MSTHFDRFEQNIQRVDNLCNIFNAVKETHNRPTIKEADILRAAVVFLHSAMEDYLRSVLIEHLPKHDAKNLDGVALLENEGRASKFNLGVLKQYSDLSVSELISKSVEEQMRHTSFNDTTDIMGWLGRIGLPTNTHGIDLSQLNTTIKRRHKIVHEVDANQQSGKGFHSAASINLRTVKAWEKNVIDLINWIESELSNFAD